MLDAAQLSSGAGLIYLSGVPLRSGSTYRVRAGFTLVEVLVCIAIIGLLVAILLPALSHGREVANKQLCAANHKAFGFAFIAFGAERKGVVCRSASMGLLKPYIDETKYHYKGCPSWGLKEYDVTSGYYGRSIGINVIIAGVGTWGTRLLRGDHIKKTHETFLLADSAGPMVGDMNLTTTEAYTVLNGRHKQDGLNFYYFDGHVQMLRPGGTINTSAPYLPDADWRKAPGSCSSPDDATGPFLCVNKGCFWHPN